ncbi:MAG: DNA primase [Corynebacterium glucuronolyticum]|nr:DNA primase [Corynebacterium glucuronolyticum]MDD7586448.1 DNA primase [Mycobacteriaceae bacterium]MDY5835446.1 DNA primase [Corynebacterium glucuronolyticum]
MARGRIPEEDIDYIRENTPIEDIVGEYVQLKPAGADSLKGLSPFKDEKTPSFHVRPNHGYFHDFSSGEGGDVFSFLMKLEHLTFPEAVEYCADKIGYHINYQGGGTGTREKAGTRQRLVAINTEAHKFFVDKLEDPEAERAREFLTGRGFTAEHARHFGCGYAPGGWDTLTKHLLRMGFSAEELEAAGVTSMGRRGPIDRFHRRLIWPIKNLAGDVIGFGARKLYDDDKLGKYLNTPETMLYKKSKVLFGIDLAKRNIAHGHQAVVVEGYTDVMAMHAAGITTAVASCGTAFGEDHLQLIRRLMLDDRTFRGEIIYTFDGDEAGQKAAMRAFEGSQEFSGSSFVAVAPGGMDPCELRQDKGDAAVRDLIARRMPMLEFVVKTVLKQYDVGTIEGRLQAVRRVVPMIGAIRDPALRSQYALQLSGWVGWLNEDELARMVEDASRRPAAAPRTPARGPAPQPTPTTVLPDPRDPALWPQRESLKIALQAPDLAGRAFDELDPEGFFHPVYRQVRDAIAAAGGASAGDGKAGWIAAITDAIVDPAVKNLVSALAVEAIRTDADHFEAYMDGAFARLEEGVVANQISNLKATLSRTRPSDDPEAYNAMFSDLLVLEQVRQELVDRAMGR